MRRQGQQRQRGEVCHARQKKGVAWSIVARVRAACFLLKRIHNKLAAMR